jgi:hypothetical protein
MNNIKYPEKYDCESKPGTFGYNTTFGPGGYTVYRILTDTAGDVYNASIADFKYRTHAELFCKGLTEHAKEK